MNVLPSSESVLKNFKRYLLTRGWVTREHPNKRLEILETKPDADGGFASIVLPHSVDFRDAGALLNEAVKLVAAFEGLDVKKIIDHILRWDRDILRSRFFKMVGHEDTLPLGVAADAVLRLKEFLGYAAYTHEHPRPFFDKAGSISGEFVEHCLFGHTFQGSFGLTIECPILVVPVLPMDGNEPVVPTERQIIERVAKGLLTLSDSIQKESIDPLLAGYVNGFNANMCRKLAEIYEKADGRRIEFDISWSAQLQSACEHFWKPMVFDGKAYEFARLAAAELEKAETFPDSLIQGRIVILKSEMPPGLDEQAEFEHMITMNWDREKDQTVKIRVFLSPDEYKVACDAHKEGRAIRIFGIPEKSGKFWTLTSQHDFSVV